MGMHLGAVHVKEFLNRRLRAQLRVHNGLFSATDVLLQLFKRHKTEDGATWLLARSEQTGGGASPLRMTAHARFEAAAAATATATPTASPQ